jgi:hypothetical protein
MRKLRTASEWRVPPAPWVKITDGGVTVVAEVEDGEGELEMHLIGFLPSRGISKSRWWDCFSIMLACGI